MPRRPKPHSNPAQHVEELQQLLSDFATELSRPDLRERVRKLVPSFHKLRDLGISMMPAHTDQSAMDRLLAYLQQYPKTVVDGDELMVVSGIGEWARRIRQLRVEEGWMINSGATYKDMAVDLATREDQPALQSLEEALGLNPMHMRPDQYVLASTEQDRDAAFRWRLLNKIRKSKASVSDKILDYFKANVGQPVLGEELRYLAPARTEWARRVRELRTEQGWAVASRMSGRPDLPVGVYMLEHDRQAEPHDREIGDAVRVAVLTRDNFACQVCGWHYDQRKPGDPRQFLELHHVTQHKDRGTNTADNLITLCNVHHDEVHRDAEAREKVAGLLENLSGPLP